MVCAHIGDYLQNVYFISFFKLDRLVKIIFTFHYFVFVSDRTA